MKIEKTQVFGFESALRGMRNPKNSWDRIDSCLCNGQDCEGCFYGDDNKKECVYPFKYCNEVFVLGDNDLKLAQTLINAGTEHCKFMRQIQVWADITMPRFWWSEMDTYKIGTSANSTSTMHKLFNKQSEVTLDLFEYDDYTKDIIETIIDELNLLREKYFESNNQKEKDNYLRQAKIILPESYLNMRTVNMNYATIRNIILQRKHHRLKLEWQDIFCKWVTTLPYAKELIFCGLEEDYERLRFKL